MNVTIEFHVDHFLLNHIFPEMFVVNDAADIGS